MANLLQGKAGFTPPFWTVDELADLNYTSRL